jgi:putative ABC transport system permease protein
MLKVALRGVFARKLRAFLTALAVFLGVSLMTGTYVLTDTFDNSFGEIFSEANEGTDVAVVPKEVVETEGRGEPPPMPARLVRAVKRVDGVAAAEGGLFSTGITMFDREGERVGSTQAPAFGASARSARFDPYDYVAGRPPRSDDEVAVDKLTADREDFEVGATVRIGGTVPARSYRISGVARLGDVDSFGGATVAIMRTGELQRLADKRGEYDTIQVAATGGVSAQELKRRIRAALPPTVDVRTGEENAAQQTRDVEEDLGFLQTALLVFAWIALFVGAFTIFNTFAITVAQRTHEFGLLRTLGAARRQVLASVMVEALVIGALGAGVGVIAGIGVASALNGLFKAAGIDLPNTGNVVETRAIVVPLFVGLVVTLVAALVPAVRATRVAPVEALREHVIPRPRRQRRAVAALALALGAAGVAAICVGLFGGIDASSQAAGLVGLGAVLLFLGTALLSPRFVVPLASAVGVPLERARKLTGRLARENAVRNPGRTATSAAALMIGLALVTLVTVFAAGLERSIDDAIERSFTADLTLQHDDGFSPIPSAAGRAVARLDGVGATSSIRFADGEVRETGDLADITAVDPAAAGRVLALDWKQGSDETLARMSRADALVDHAWGADNDVHVGDTLTVTTPTGRDAVYTVRGTIEAAGDVYDDIVLTHEAVEDDFRQRQESLILLRFAPGADPAAVRAQVERVIERAFPVVDVLDQEELKDSISNQLATLVNLLYVLLSLAVIVSLFGIVNTLTLSIYERTRELGLLRAIGMSRRQVRRVVRYEAVITALLGVLVGSVLGVFFAVIVSRPLADDGFTLAFPVDTLAILFALTAIAGVIAAILPARRASRLDVLEALAYE